MISPLPSSSSFNDFFLHLINQVVSVSDLSEELALSQYLYDASDSQTDGRSVMSAFLFLGKYALRSNNSCIEEVDPMIL